MKVFVFDFDNTIVEDHTHNKISRSKRKGANKQAQEYDNADWSKVRDLATIGSDSLWKQVFESLWQQGHYLSIASFNAYKPIISLFLSRIGLSNDFIQQIDIIAEYPKDPKTATKNPYIEQAFYNAQTIYPEEKVDEVILIDDSDKNIEAANQLTLTTNRNVQIRCTTIKAYKAGSHLTKLFEKYIAPGSQYLEPPAREAAATYFDEGVFADLTRNSDGPTSVTYADQTSEYFFPEESKTTKDQLPPVNRHLKPYALEAAASLPIHCAITPEEAASFDSDIFADLTRNLDGSTSVTYADQTSEYFFPEESKTTKDQLPPVNRHLKPYALEAAATYFDEGAFADLTLNSDGSSVHFHPEEEYGMADQHGTPFNQSLENYVAPPAKRHLKPSFQMAASTLPSQFGNFFSHSPGKPEDKEPLEQDQSLQTFTYR